MSGAFVAALHVQGRRCVLISSETDLEMDRRAASLRTAGACVERIREGDTESIDLRDVFLVLAAVSSDVAAQQLCERSRETGFLLCCIDRPAYSNLSMTAIAARGPVRVAVSTSGVAPRVAKQLRVALDRAMDETFERFIGELARLRARARADYPGSEQAAQRIKQVLGHVRGFQADVRFRYPAWFEDRL